jgi:hypothetical protein
MSYVSKADTTNLQKWFHSLPYRFYFEDSSSTRSKLYNQIKNKWDSDLAIKLNKCLCKNDRYNEGNKYF